MVHQYIEQSASVDFQMADVMRIKTRVAEIEQKSVNEQVETQVIDRLQEVQERAYQEGMAVGREDGRQQALEEHSQLLREKLDQLDALFQALTSLKAEILQANEMHFIKFSVHLAERLAGQHIKVNPEALLNLIRKTVEMAQGEENIRIRVSPEQKEFIEKMRSELKPSQANEVIRNASLEGDPSISPGGVVVQTNYSEIDARTEERVAVLWEVISEQLIAGQDDFAA